MVWAGPAGGRRFGVTPAASSRPPVAGLVARLVRWCAALPVSALLGAAALAALAWLAAAHPHQASAASVVPAAAVAPAALPNGSGGTGSDGASPDNGCANGVCPAKVNKASGASATTMSSAVSASGTRRAAARVERQAAPAGEGATVKTVKTPAPAADNGGGTVRTAARPRREPAPAETSPAPKGALSRARLSTDARQAPGSSGGQRNRSDRPASGCQPSGGCGGSAPAAPAPAPPTPSGPASVNGGGSSGAAHQGGSAAVGPEGSAGKVQVAWRATAQRRPDLTEPEHTTAPARGPPTRLGEAKLTAKATSKAGTPADESNKTKTAPPIQQVKLLSKGSSLAKQAPADPSAPPKPAPGAAPGERGGPKYVIGSPTRPKFNFRDDYVYNPKAKAGFGDYRSWVEWGIKADGATVVRSDLDDALPLYKHYRDNTGTPMTVDYAEAYREDPSIRKTVDNEIASAQHAVERIHKETGKSKFSITGDPTASSPYPQTEKWQKALGAHQVWGSGDVKIEGNKVTMTITVHAEDRYNFNKDSNDLATGTPDQVNGRFAELGWAKGFNTSGSITKTVTWTLGSPDAPVTTKPEETERNPGGGREDRADERDSSR